MITHTARTRGGGIGPETHAGCVSATGVHNWQHNENSEFDKSDPCTAIFIKISNYLTLFTFSA